jgi:hypothetical protein
MEIIEKQAIYYEVDFNNVVIDYIDNVKLVLIKALNKCVQWDLVKSKSFIDTLFNADSKIVKFESEREAKIVIETIRNLLTTNSPGDHGNSDVYLFQIGDEL